MVRHGHTRKHEAFHLKTNKNGQDLLCSLNADSTSLCLLLFCNIRLTAYVAKVFAMAYQLVDIDPDIICGAIKFVILNSQLPDGSFKEIGKLYHGNMMVCILSSKILFSCR